MGLVVDSIIKNILENHGPDAGQATEQPHRGAAHHRVARAPYSCCAQGVNDSEVPVEGQERQEKDRAVEAQMIDAAHHLAHNVAKDPVLQLHVSAQEGKAAHEDERGIHQVQQQDVGRGGQLLKPR